MDPAGRTAGCWPAPRRYCTHRRKGIDTRNLTNVAWRCELRRGHATRSHTSADSSPSSLNRPVPPSAPAGAGREHPTSRSRSHLLKTAIQWTPVDSSATVPPRTEPANPPSLSGRPSSRRTRAFGKDWAQGDAFRASLRARASPDELTQADIARRRRSTLVRPGPSNNNPTATAAMPSATIVPPCSSVCGPHTSDSAVGTQSPTYTST